MIESGSYTIKIDHALSHELLDLKKQWLESLCDVTTTVDRTKMVVGWKKAIAVYKDREVHCIVKLMVPTEAEIIITTHGKYRTDLAIVCDVQDMAGDSIPYDHVRSMYDKDFTYRIGDIIRPTEKLDTNPWHECSVGIHFFIYRPTAVQYGS